MLVSGVEDTIFFIGLNNWSNISVGLFNNPFNAINIKWLWE